MADRFGRALCSTSPLAAAALVTLLAACPTREPPAIADAAPPADAAPADAEAGADAAASLLPWTPPQQVTELMPFGFFGSYDDPSITGDLTEIVFGAEPRRGDPGENEDIWRAVRAGPDEPWSELARVDELSTDLDETGASISFDGLTIVFARQIDALGRDFDMFIATRPSRDQPWQTPRPLDEINTARSESPGQLSLDGLTLYFASDRAGDFDIYKARRAAPGAPFTAVEAIPGAAEPGVVEISPTISADDTELGYAAAPIGEPLELFLAGRDAFGVGFAPGAPIAELNSSGDESDLRLGPNGRYAVMASDRTVRGRNRIWTTSR